MTVPREALEPVRYVSDDVAKRHLAAQFARIMQAIELLEIRRDILLREAPARPADGDAPQR